jgi:hypothetical protein
MRRFGAGVILSGAVLVSTQVLAPAKPRVEPVALSLGIEITPTIKRVDAQFEDCVSA